MRATVEYKGQSVTLDIPDAKLEELIAEKKPRTGYERAERGDRYYAAVYDGEVMPTREDGDRTDETRYAAASYYTDERFARDNARADMLMRQLRGYAAEHSGVPNVGNWRTDTVKWCVEYNYPYTFIGKGAHRTTRDAGIIYFRSQEACEAAITEFHDELLWYFTEYDPQVRA